MLCWQLLAQVQDTGLLARHRAHPHSRAACYNAELMLSWQLLAGASPVDAGMQAQLLHQRLLQALDLCSGLLAAEP